MKIKKRHIFLNFLILIVLSVSAVLSLRDNNIRMLELRDKVFEADKNDSGLIQALDELRKHVTSNMNSDLPKLGDSKAIQLKYSYERAVSKEQDRYQKDVNDIGQDAKKYCLSSINELSRVECEQNYITKNPAPELKKVYPEQYSIEFISPRWSFDLAGWLIVATLMSGFSLLFVILKQKLSEKV